MTTEDMLAANTRELARLDLELAEAKRYAETLRDVLSRAYEHIRRDVAAGLGDALRAEIAKALAGEM